MSEDIYCSKQQFKRGKTYEKAWLLNGAPIYNKRIPKEEQTATCSFTVEELDTEISDRVLSMPQRAIHFSKTIRSFGFDFYYLPVV